MRPSRTTAAGAAALLLAGVAALAVPAVAGPARADVPAAPRMNVLMVLTDDQTMDAVARMPHLSQQRWVRFSNARVENGLCCPARATILQGRYDVHTHVTNNAQGNLFDPGETLPVWLQRAGYATGLFGKYLNSYEGDVVPPGWSDWQGVFGQPQYTQYDYGLNANGVREQHGSAPEDYEVDVIAGRAESFIRRSAAAGEPFFAYVAPTATHSPWTASPGRTGAFDGAAVHHDPSFNEADVSDKPAHIRAQPLLSVGYEDASRRKEWAASLSVDDALARLDQTLVDTGTYDNTVLVFTGDNGYSFGDHRWERKRCEYNECSKVPLLVRYPGQGPRTDRHMISNVDLASTVAQLAGTTPALPQDGRSFLHFVDPGYPGGTRWRSRVLQHWSGGDSYGRPGKPDSFPQFWSVVTADGWKYVELDTGEKELYDERADPYELGNRAGQSAYATRQAGLQADLVRLKRAAGVGAAAGNTMLPGPGVLGTDLD